MKMDYDLAGRVIGAATEVHRTLGPGFLESVYENARALELSSFGINFESQKALKVRYKFQNVGDFYADMIVENVLVVEIKAFQSLKKKFRKPKQLNASLRFQF